MASHGVINAIFGSYDLSNAKNWRNDDIVYREQQVQWLNDDIARAHEWRRADIIRELRCEKLESEHIACDARADQLSTVAEQCALLSGFCIISMSNLGLPDDLNYVVFFLYAVSCSAVAITLFLSAVMCTTLTLAVTRYAGEELEHKVEALDLTELHGDSPFGLWWIHRCEQQQMTAYKFLVVGISMFFLYLVLVIWIQFDHSLITTTSMSVVIGVAFLTWQLRMISRWRYLFTPPRAPRHLQHTLLNASLEAQQRQARAFSSNSFMQNSETRKNNASTFDIPISPTTQSSRTNYVQHQS